jgi:hypothetical protein
VLHKNEVNVTRYQLRCRHRRVLVGLKEATTPWVIRPSSTALKTPVRRTSSELEAVHGYLANYKPRD